MFNRRFRHLAAGLVFAGVLGTSAAFSQAPATRPATAPAIDANAVRAMVPFDANQYRKAESDRMRDRLGATEEEWKTLEPMIQKVQTLQSQLSGRGIGLGMGMGMIMPGPGPDTSDQVKELMKELAKTAQDLATVIADKDAGPDRIKLALKDYRQARVKAKAEIEKAQKELKEVLTVRQEAVLKQMSVLE
jgi:DNA repair exonuclease SbcCD ATPase subunit